MNFIAFQVHKSKNIIHYILPIYSEDADDLYNEIKSNGKASENGSALKNGNGKHDSSDSKMDDEFDSLIDNSKNDHESSKKKESAKRSYSTSSDDDVINKSDDSDFEEKPKKTASKKMKPSKPSVPSGR